MLSDAQKTALTLLGYKWKQNPFNSNLLMITKPDLGMTWTVAFQTINGHWGLRSADFLTEHECNELATILGQTHGIREN